MTRSPCRAAHSNTISASNTDNLSWLRPFQSECAAIDSTDCYSLPLTRDYDYNNDVTPGNAITVMAAELAGWAYLEEDELKGNMSTYYTTLDPTVYMIHGTTGGRIT